MVKIEERLRKLVIAKIQDGASERQVSKDLGICRSSKQNIWLKFANTVSIADRPRSGLPKELADVCVWKPTKFHFSVRENLGRVQI